VAAPARVHAWQEVLQPGESRPYDSEYWDDAIVWVACGRVTLEASDGGRWHFLHGHVLSLAGLPLVRLRNESEAPAVLVAVRRRSRDRPDAGPAGPRPDGTSASGPGRPKPER
jgi:hypothetical protein